MAILCGNINILKKYFYSEYSAQLRNENRAKSVAIVNHIEEYEWNDE